MSRSSAVLFAASLGVLVAQIDSSVTNLALAPIGADLDAGLGALQWVMDAYSLAYAALLLAGGALADRYGRRRVFGFGMAVLLLASVACALAPSIGLLIAARGVAGLGAALAMPASLAMINVAFPEARARARAMGIWASCNGLAMAIGPSAGGWLVQALGWRSVFWAALPICAGALLALRGAGESRDPNPRALDLPGQILGAAAVGAFSGAAIESAEHGATAALPLALFLLAIAALALFVLQQRRRGEAATLSPALLHRPQIKTALTVTALMTFGMYGMLLLVPLDLQRTRHLDPFHAGLVLLPLSLIFVLVSQFSGATTARIGKRWAIIAGMALMGAGLALAAGTIRIESIAPLVASLVVSGIGLGLTTGPVLGAATETAPHELAGMAGALANVARMVGATLGVAIIGATFAAAGIRLALLLGAASHLAGAALALRGLRR